MGRPEKVVPVTILHGEVRSVMADMMELRQVLDSRGT
jgi:hypothetical protein